SKEVQLLKDVLTLLAAAEGEAGEDTAGSDAASSDSGAEDSAGEESGGDEAAPSGSDMDTCDTQVPMQSTAEESSVKKVLPPVPKFLGILPHRKENAPSSVDSVPPASDLAPSAEMPVKSQAPECEIPVKSLAPECEMPVKSQASECEIPVKSEASECEIPVKSQASGCEIPVKSQSPECEIPVKSQAPKLECEIPVKSQAPAAAVPPDHVPDMQCPDSANPEPMSGTESPTLEKPVKEEASRAAEKAASEPLIQERPSWNVDAKIAELKAKGYIQEQPDQKSLDEYAGTDNPTPEPGHDDEKKECAAVSHTGRGKKRASAEEQEACEATKKPKKGTGKAKNQPHTEPPASSNKKQGAQAKAKAVAKKEEPTGEDVPARRRFRRSDFGDINIPNFKDYYATGQL
ncbi:unnamed protein product, partial [Symbiodinium microadriaticum]